LTISYCLDIQRTNKSQGNRIKREKGYAQTHYSIQYIEGYILLYYKNNQQDLHSSIIDTNSKEYCPGTMNIYFIWDRQEYNVYQEYHEISLNTQDAEQDVQH
jgi:hypothetical protein